MQLVNNFDDAAVLHELLLIAPATRQVSRRQNCPKPEELLAKRYQESIIHTSLHEVALGTVPPTPGAGKSAATGDGPVNALLAIMLPSSAGGL